MGDGTSKYTVQMHLVINTAEESDELDKLQRPARQQSAPCNKEKMEFKR